MNCNCNIIEKDLYIFATNSCFDINLLSSLTFNKFFNYLNGVLNLKDNNMFEFEGDGLINSLTDECQTH